MRKRIGLGSIAERMKWPSRGREEAGAAAPPVPAAQPAPPAEQMPSEAKGPAKARGLRPASGQVRLLEGEEEAERLGDHKHSLILTNKRVIYLSRRGQTSRAAVAFLTDIVTVRVRRSRPNKMFPVMGIVLGIGALVWSLYAGLGSGFNSPTMAVVLIADMILVLGCLILYVSSACAIIVFKTANDEIAFALGQEDNVYRFINRWLELKDRVT